MRYGYKAMKPKRIILIRHGESAGNNDPRFYQESPDHKIALTPGGIEQAREAGKILKEKILCGETVRIYSSPYKRARQTRDGLLDAIADNVEKKYEEPRLREQDWGNLRPFLETEKIKEERHNYSRFYYRFPDGESGADVYDRVSTFLETLYRDFDKEYYPPNTLIVSHGLTILLFLMRWFHWNVGRFEQTRKPKNCQILVMEMQHGGKYRLTSELK